MAAIKIGSHILGDNAPTYLIADIGANHDGDLERAKNLIYLAAESGAHAAKFQNFVTEKIISARGFEQLGGKLSHHKNFKKSVFQCFEDAVINKDWTPILKQTCVKAGIDYFTSPYDFDSADLVDPYVEFFKIGSGEITWLELIDHIAKKGKPVILATGASELADVERAVDLLLKITDQLCLMQCNTNYTGNPDNFKYLNLNVLLSYKVIFPNLVLGLSDHTPGHTAALGALVLGARVIEKHFTDDTTREGPDHSIAMTPKTWKEMALRIRELEMALGDGKKRIEGNEKESVIIQRRCLRAAKNLKGGETLSRESLVPLRPIPKDGIPPYEIEKLIGKRLEKPLNRGEHITWGHVR